MGHARYKTVSFLLLFCNMALAGGQESILRAGVSTPYLGAKMDEARVLADVIKNSGADSARLWFPLGPIFPDKPQNGAPLTVQNTFKIKEKLDELVDRNLEILYVAAYAPKWARKDSSKEFSPYKDPRDFGAVVKAFLTYTEDSRNRISAIECWNEPNGATFWADETYDDIDAMANGYAKMFIECAKAAKSVRSTIRVGIAGLQTSGKFVSPSNYLKAVLAKLKSLNALNLVDFVGLHYYSEKNAGEMKGTVDTIAGIMSQNGLPSTPIYLTEYGVKKGDKAAFVADAFQVMAGYPNIKRSYYFLFNPNSGNFCSRPNNNCSHDEKTYYMIDNDFVPTAAYLAFRNVATRTQFVRETLVSSGGYTVSKINDRIRNVMISPNVTTFAGVKDFWLPRIHSYDSLSVENYVDRTALLLSGQCMDSQKRADWISKINQDPTKRENLPKAIVNESNKFEKTYLRYTQVQRQSVWNFILDGAASCAPQSPVPPPPASTPPQASGGGGAK